MCSQRAKQQVGDDDDTDKILQHIPCLYHGQLSSRTKRNEQDIQTVWKAIDRMTGWVIAGSASMILTLIGIIVQFISKGNN